MASIVQLILPYAQDIRTGLAVAFCHYVVLLLAQYLSRRLAPAVAKKPGRGWSRKVADATFGQSTASTDVDVPHGCSLGSDTLAVEEQCASAECRATAGLAILEHYGAFGVAAGTWCASSVQDYMEDHDEESEYEWTGKASDGDEAQEACAAEDSENDLDARRSCCTSLSPGLRLLEQYGALGAAPGAWSGCAT